MNKLHIRKSRTSPSPRLARRTTASLLVTALSVTAAMFGAPAPASAAVACPKSTASPLISYWETSYAQKAVTLCRAYNWSGEVVASVQIVDFEAGGKMRVMSDSSQPVWNDSVFATKTANEWFDWVGASVGTPAPSRLFSVTNGSFSMRDEYDNAMMSFPEKKWNAMTTAGSDRNCHYYQGASAKRYFGLSDPRPESRQFAYIDTYSDPCQAWDPAEANSKLSSYRGQPVSLFDATVAYHPLYGAHDAPQRRTFLGTRSTDGLWHGTQDRAYLLTSEVPLTLSEARDILTGDFATMYNIQLSGGYDTQFQSVAGGLESSDPSGDRRVPEVLVIYNAP